MLPIIAGRLPPPITAVVLGARTIAGACAPRYARLPDDIPGSRIIAVDIEPDGSYPDGWEFCPAVIGRRTETRPFYRGNSPAISSLYEINWALLTQYTGLEVYSTTHIEEVQAISLDEFTESRRPVHFIAADIQGAELEAIEGGDATLADTLMFVTELCFAPLYRAAPPWRALDAALDAAGFEFYRILGGAIRPELRYAMPEGDGACAGRWLWGDAMYVRKDRWSLGVDSIWRLAALAHLYGQYCLAAACLERIAGYITARDYIVTARAGAETKEPAGAGQGDAGQKA